MKQYLLGNYQPDGLPPAPVDLETSDATSPP
jgi:hypothetical protein